MNWTEGRLQRHSSTNRKSTAQQRQKAHFARVQQNLRNGSLNNKNSPVRFSVFGIDVRDRERLDQYLSPAVQGSAVKCDDGARRPRDSLESAQLLLHPVPERRASKSRDCESSQRRRPAPLKRNPSQAPEDDLYGATPPPRPIKRKHNAGVSESDMASVSEGKTVKEPLSEIRRRLLRRGDWVGVTRQKPLELVYGSVKDGKDIGRRRKVNEQHRARYRSAQSQIESPFPARNRSHQYEFRGGQHMEGSQPIAPDVRIFIGGRKVPPGVSSSTGRRYGASTSGKRSSRAVSSEMLLLDSGSSRGVLHDGHTRDQYENSRRTESLLLASSRATSHCRLYEATRRSHSLLALSSQDDLPGWDEEQEQDQGWAGVTEDSLAKLQQNFQGSSESGDKSSDRSSRKAAPDVNLRRNLHPGQEIFSSSSAPMHHPKPRTSKRSVLLQEGSSQLAESNLAQLGKLKSAVSSSQQHQDEIWRSWVVAEGAGEDDDEQSSEGLLGDGWISPGPSMAPPMRPPTRFIPDEDAYSSELEAPDDPDQVQEVVSGDGSEESSQGNSASQDEVSVLGEDGDLTMKSMEIAAHSQNAEASMVHCTSRNGEKDSTDIRVSLLSPHGAVVRVPDLAMPAPHPASQAGDPDELWRKFVFGRSDEVMSPDCSTAEHSNPCTKAPGHSSIIGNPSSGQKVLNTFHSQSSAQPESSQRPQSTDNSREHSLAQPNSFISSPTRDRRTSMYASNGPVSSSSYGHAQTSTAIHARSPSSLSCSDYSYPHKRPQKVLFTKPKPFIGRNSNVDVARDEVPLYMEQGSRNDEEDFIAGQKRKNIDHVSHFAEDELGELESIEDY
ncbi:hypothetical protein ONS95_006100 [Cadophora gregata]|uniref:uncharacterized protein n=1 Tax=Cadophora gregata TaxID=51156 RepID=UPI0026DC49D6|nr:uncharacterized protein ONS95_006100 [Cadophora gregata]KAK0102484.1 hypothetical protein ONS95_006100 [Cadophora gregata]